MKACPHCGKPWITRWQTRAANDAKMRALLIQKPWTAQELAAELGIAINRVYSWLTAIQPKKSAGPRRPKGSGMQPQVFWL